MYNSMLVAVGKHWDWWEAKNLLSEDGMIMIGSQVYIFTTTRQQGESPAMT
jgi:hypothetical protein